MSTPRQPTVERMRWTPYRVPLHGSFSSAHERLVTRAGIIVELHTSSGTVGIGECAPLPEFSGGTLQDVMDCLPLVAPRLQGLVLSDALALLDQLQDTLPTAARCGLETAVLDALGQHYQCSLTTLLALPDLIEPPSTQDLERAASQVRTSVPVNTVIGAQDVAAAVAQARQAVAQGFTCIKLKVGPQLRQTVELLTAVRAALGPSIHLRLDANESWDFELARSILSSCEFWSIQYVEQPLPRTDLAGMAALRRVVPISIAADEVLSDLASARRVLARNAAGIFVIKPQLAGGPRQSQRMVREATAHGVRCVITSTIETGIGVVMALHLAAAMPEITLECGLATLPLLTDDLIQEALPIQNGHMEPPATPGLGIHLDQATLARYAGSH
ncbi:o-succinylbenzoate synthase [Dictyobacter aurantiacus]|uniref:o-succinylbenzoate synthase n=1 Tax=Dictyobacter aurantiacus TaxID=1936993 RepID=A0A401ZAM6_9CHLR|nr:o-succinylbenzoate synthase [Dictyobacter aurantiacus]GCE03924.1 hypothetical protein KDAU_12530 [Dictyobacter aurantiacus]